MMLMLLLGPPPAFGLAVDAMVVHLHGTSSTFVAEYEEVRSCIQLRSRGKDTRRPDSSVKKNRIRLSAFNPSASVGSKRFSTARQIQSKRTEFVCPSLVNPSA